MINEDRSGAPGSKQIGEQIARWLSRIFHPFVISLVAFWLALYLSGSSALQALQWVGLGFLVVIAPLAVVILYNVQSGKFTDLDVSIREHRYKLYSLAFVCFILLIVILNLLNAPRIALGCLYAAVTAIFLGAIINRVFTKVSLHSVASAGSAAVLFVVSPIPGLILGVIALAVGWARIRLKRHTPGQVLLGWLIAIVCVGAILPLFTG